MRRLLVSVVTVSLAACAGSSGSDTTDAGTTTETGTGNASGAPFCDHSASVPVAGLGLTSTVRFTCTATERLMTSNGLPDHEPGKFPNAHNPNTIRAQDVSATTTLTPAAAASSSQVKEPGYLHNGVKLDPATAESYQNAGVWRIEAIQPYLNLGLDDSHAHVQPNGAYHYHGMPVGYMDRLGKGEAMTFVGFATDGFPIYARYGHENASDATSAVRAMKPSYRLKATPDSGRPSAGDVPLGVFTQDYEYVAGLGDLDECNGRTGVTPEYPKGTYHYFITDEYPYLQRCVKGTPAAGAMGPPGSGGTGGGTGGGGGTQPGPKSCTQASDCTDACPPGSKGCTCSNSPQGMICVPTCETSSDCPQTPTGQAMTCAPEKLCHP